MGTDHVRSIGRGQERGRGQEQERHKTTANVKNGNTGREEYYG
jgi:hypothetical protein